LTQNRDEGSNAVIVYREDASGACARAARSAGIPAVLDGGSWKPGTDELLRHVDIAICSADFLPPGCSSEEEVIGFLSRRGVGKIAITLGAEALRFVSGVRSGTIEVPQVDAVDTMGAAIFSTELSVSTARRITNSKRR